MTLLRLRFAAGTLHAPLWATGMSSSEIEWPPAPLRILTALFHAWLREGARDVATFERLMRSLAAPPTYALPKSMIGASRHRGRAFSSEGRESAPLFDSVLALDRETEVDAIVEWGADVDADSRVMLERLASGAGGLGNDARVEFAMGDADALTGPRTIVAPGHIESGQQVAKWLRGLDADFPPGLFERLALLDYESLVPESAVMRHSYLVSLDDGVVNEHLLASPTPVFEPMTVRFGISPVRGALPSIADSLDVAEAFRGAMISAYSRLHGRPVTKYLAGKDERGEPRSGHGHPYILPRSRSSDGFIDEIDVVLPEGCAHDEYAALVAIRAIYDDGRLRGRFQVEARGVTPAERSTTWESATPVVLDRFPKIRGGGTRIIDGAEDQIANALRRRGLPEADVRVWANDRSLGGLPKAVFRHRRVGSSPKPMVGATIVFVSAVEGPIVLGSLAHFGLGRFEPAR